MFLQISSLPSVCTLEGRFDHAPHAMRLGCAGVRSPPVLLGSGLSWAAMCEALTQGKTVQSPGRTVYLHGRVSLPWGILENSLLSPLLLSQSGKPSARSCTWPRAAGFWELLRGEVYIAGIVIYKLAAFAGTGPSSSSRGKNGWQRSLKKACFGERRSLLQEQYPEL